MSIYICTDEAETFSPPPMTPTPASKERELVPVVRIRGGNWEPEREVDWEAEPEGDVEFGYKLGEEVFPPDQVPGFTSQPNFHIDRLIWFLVGPEFAVLCQCCRWSGVERTVEELADCTLGGLTLGETKFTLDALVRARLLRPTPGYPRGDVHRYEVEFDEKQVDWKWLEARKRNLAAQDAYSEGTWVVENVLVDVWARKIGPYAFSVYCLLARMADAVGVSSPSYNWIATRLGISRAQAIRGIETLLEWGLIEKEAHFTDIGGQSPNRYRLIDVFAYLDPHSEADEEATDPDEDDW